VASGEAQGEDEAPGGSLTVVGSGIKAIAQLTAEAKAHVEQAEKVLYAVSDPITAGWLPTLNPSAESLSRYYAEGKPRDTTYREMTARILACVREGLRTVAVFYGHPGVFVRPSLDALAQARAEGFPARMLPGVSAEDCLFADLEVDPARDGCQSYEATSFLIHGYRVEPRSALILWQVGAIGHADFHPSGYAPHGIPPLLEALLPVYGAQHPVVVYEAAWCVLYPPRIERIPLAGLAAVRLSPISTLYIPPLAAAVPDPAVRARLGLS
jgi:hypothetical protein